MVIGKANRAQTTIRVGRIGAVAAFSALSLVLLAGCAAGQRAQTSVEQAVIDGVDAHTANISINDLSVSPPANGSSYAAGDNAPLQMVLVNTGSVPMQLSTVTTDASVAASVTVSPTFLPDTSASTSVDDSDSAGDVPTDAASESSSPLGGTSPAASSPAATPSAATTSAPASKPISVPVGSAVQVGLPGASASVVLNDLAKPLYPAENITIVFNFANGESLSVLANVHLDPGDSTAPTLPVADTAGD